ncbi:MAG: hypothetical protein AAFP04_10150 [Myxococcota bacterium]
MEFKERITLVSVLGITIACMTACGSDPDASTTNPDQDGSGASTPQPTESPVSDDGPSEPGGGDNDATAVSLADQAQRLHATAEFCPSDSFIASERQVENLDGFENVSDHEFDSENLRIVFTNSGPEERVIVAGQIDPTTGDVQSTETVDGDNLFQTCPGLPFGNGPEYGVSDEGSALYYAKSETDPDAGLPNPYLVRARRVSGESSDIDGTGFWSIERLPDSDGRACVLSSIEPESPETWLVHTRSQLDLDNQLLTEFVWRFDEEVPVETPVFGVNAQDISGGSPGRKVPGRLELVAAVDDEFGQTQIARVDLATGITESISTYEACDADGDGECEPTALNSVSVVAVPKLGDDVYLYYGIINDSFIDAYLVKGVIGETAETVQLPPIRPESRLGVDFIVDEENLLDPDENPIIIFSMGDAASNGSAGDVWIANPFAEEPCRYRKVSEDDGAAIVSRTDLDSLTIPGETSYVYFHRKPDADRTVLFRAETGL